MGYNLAMLPDLRLNDIVRMKKKHPCGSTNWKVTRLGADIGLVCCQCGRRIMLSRRELSHKMKTTLKKESHATTSE
jgi:hypothetical protein